MVRYTRLFLKQVMYKLLHHTQNSVVTDNMYHLLCKSALIRRHSRNIPKNFDYLQFSYGYLRLSTENK